MLSSLNLTNTYRLHKFITNMLPVSVRRRKFNQWYFRYTRLKVSNPLLIYGPVTMFIYGRGGGGGAVSEQERVMVGVCDLEKKWGKECVSLTRSVTCVNSNT